MRQGIEIYAKSVAEESYTEKSRAQIERPLHGRWPVCPRNKLENPPVRWWGVWSLYDSESSPGLWEEELGEQCGRDETPGE